MSTSGSTSHDYKSIPNEDIDDEEETRSISSTININLTNVLKLTSIRRRQQQQSNNIEMKEFINNTDDQKQMQVDTENENEQLLQLQDQDQEQEHEQKEFDFELFLLQIGEKKRQIGINSNWTVLKLKEIYFTFALLNQQNIRLIYRGRILEDNKLIIDDYHIPNKAFLHVAISSSTNNSSNKNNKNEKQFENKVNIDDAFDDGLDDNQIARRLQAEEFRLFRNRNGNNNNNNNRMNNRFINMNINDDNNNNNNDEDSDNINEPISDDINNNNNNNNNSNNFHATELDQRRDFACGFFLGLMAGIWVFFILLFVRRQYSRRFRLGILTGMMFNLMLEYFNQQANAHLHETDTANIDSSNPQNTNIDETSAGGTGVDDNLNDVNGILIGNINNDIIADQ